MTATSGQQLSVGLRYACVFALDSNGLPAATSTAVYEGVEFGGAKAFELSVPDVRRVSHVGNDRVLALDFLPPTDGMSGELRIARHEQAINAVLTGVTQFTLGDIKAVAWATDKQGYEPDVALLLFQQSLDATTKLRRWRYIIVPKARVIPYLSGMSDNASEVRYIIAPSPSTKHIWGTSFALLTEGVTEASVIEGMSEGRPAFVAWKGTGAEDEFLFPTAKPSASNSKLVVWDNGTLKVLTTDYTATSTKITFEAGDVPALGNIVCAFYEY